MAVGLGVQARTVLRDQQYAGELRLRFQRSEVSIQSLFEIGAAIRLVYRYIPMSCSRFFARIFSFSSSAKLSRDRIHDAGQSVHMS